MTTEREFEGKDLEAALDNASSALKVPEAELHYEILEQGRRGLLGVGVKSVRIRVMPPLETELPDHLTDPQPNKPERPSRRSKGRPRKAKRESQTEPVETKPAGVVTELSQEVEQTVRKMVQLLGLDLQVEGLEEDSEVNLQFTGPDRKMLTSRNAELLLALQFLLNRMARRTWPDVRRIHMGCNGLKRPHENDLVALAKRVAKQVSTTGKTKKLRPMNAYERRLVHLTVREFAGLTSSSDGNGALKRVRISKVQNAI